jgi:hypothetical protein
MSPSSPQKFEKKTFSARFGIAVKEKKGKEKRRKKKKKKKKRKLTSFIFSAVTSYKRLRVLSARAAGPRTRWISTFFSHFLTNFQKKN